MLDIADERTKATKATTASIAPPTPPKTRPRMRNTRCGDSECLAIPPFHRERGLLSRLVPGGPGHSPRCPSCLPALVLQVPSCHLKEDSRGGRHSTTAGVHRIGRSRQRRVGVEHLDELLCREPFAHERSRHSDDAESAHRGVKRERNAVHDEASTHRDLDRPSARTEGPASPGCEGREEDAVVPEQVAWRTRCSAVAQVFARRKAALLCAPQLMRHEGGVLQRARAEREVELLLHELNVSVGEHQLDAHVGMPRETLRDNLAEKPLAEGHRRRHAQSSGGLLGAGRERTTCFQDRSERWTTGAQVGLTRARELHVARRTLKETRAERTLKLTDPAAHRRAWDPQGIGGSPKAPQLRHADEELDGANLDCPVHGTHSSTRLGLPTRHLMHYSCRRRSQNMAQKLTVVVTGSTGKQGGTVARGLLERGHKVRAITRDPNSSQARVLAKAGATLVAASLEDTAAITKALEGATSLFAMTTPSGGSDAEIRQGVAAANAAKATDLHLVFTSVGSANRQTGVPHFDSKYEVEQHIAQIGVRATILAPVTFMENLFFAKEQLAKGVYAAGLPPTRTLAQVAVEDIGAVAVRVLEDAGRFTGKRFDLASDELTGNDAAAILSRVAGRPFAYDQIPLDVIRQRMGEEAAKMYEWFDRVGFAVDRAALRREFPDIAFHDFESWAAKQDWNALLRSA